MCFTSHSTSRRLQTGGVALTGEDSLAGWKPGPRHPDYRGKLRFLSMNLGHSWQLDTVFIRLLQKGRTGNDGVRSVRDSENIKPW